MLKYAWAIRQYLGVRIIANESEFKISSTVVDNDGRVSILISIIQIDE